MSIQKLKEGNSFNTYTQFFLIDGADDLDDLEQEYHCSFGDEARTPEGTVYVRLSDDYQGEKWTIKSSSSSGSNLPAVTADDNDDVLTVVEGAWAKAAPSGGLPPITKITETIFAEQSVTFSIDDGYGWAELNCEDIIADGIYTVEYEGVSYSGLVGNAIPVDSTCIGNMALYDFGPDTGEPFLIVSEGNSTSIAIISDTATHTLKITKTEYSPENGSVYVAVNGEWVAQAGYGYTDDNRTVKIKSAFLPNAPLIIHIVQDEQATSGYAIDKTAKEICDAWENGNRIMLDDGEYRYPVTRVPSRMDTGGSIDGLRFELDYAQGNDTVVNARGLSVWSSDFNGLIDEIPTVDTYNDARQVFFSL